MKENVIYGFMFATLLVYLAFALNYEVNDFYYPIYILATCFSATLLPLLLIQKLSLLKTFIPISLAVALLFCSSNYIFSSEVDGPYPVIDVEIGKGKSKNLKIQLENKLYTLNFRKYSSNKGKPFILYRGIFGLIHGKYVT